jgi:hypothetical protein
LGPSTDVLKAPLDPMIVTRGLDRSEMIENRRSDCGIFPQGRMGRYIALGANRETLPPDVLQKDLQR